eukprot:TRINITY_DN924_c0_g1_i2.p1 TRINITY_DN924_c0_g1~~TRINITY_DN924_c0_g1_i2.p1  ORF type:complete len:126 (+),score=46.24 TRINITY_DN924_c0_g1_i2:114-491(+)
MSKSFFLSREPCYALFHFFANAVQKKQKKPAAVNLEKLKMFRHYYLVVVCYIYLTRIIVYLLERSLHLRWTWVSVFVVEVATLSFYCLTGYLFRPVADNPYLKVESDEGDADVGIEMDEMGEAGV